MAKPNYGFEKRQRETAKKKKKEDKLFARANRKADGSAPDGEGEAPADPADPAAPGDTAGQQPPAPGTPTT